jgi:O-antigen ligase
MSSALAAHGSAPSSLRTALAVAAILAFSILAGLAAGDRSPEWSLPMAAIGAAMVLYAGLRWPFSGLLIMLASSILLVVVRTFGLRSINAFDVLLMPVFFVSLWGRARQDSRARVLLGESHERIREAEGRFTNSVIVFHVGALLSLVQLGVLVGVHAALDSALLLLRAVQGLLLYPICRWWLFGQNRVERAWDAIVVGGFGLAATALAGVFLWDVRRPGMTLYLNDISAPLASPNEAGVNALFVAAILLVRHAHRPDWKNVAGVMLMVLVLVLTQSRSALLAWAVFALFTLRWASPRRLLAGALSLAALLPLIPANFWARMAKSVVVEKGSFEAMSFLQRVYGWRTAWRVVQDHPWTGVGYLGFRYVSDQYNELRLKMVTVENYFYEILVSMGIVGLILIGIVIVRLFRLGSTVGRVAPKGTLAHHMARFHAPLMVALLVANLTVDNFFGLVSLTQVALWCAVLVQSGHEAVSPVSPA